VCSYPATLVSAEPVSLPQKSEASGDAAGKALLNATCTQCHGLAPIAATRDGPRGWAEKVHKMIAWGAQINDEKEATTLIGYLSATYGPSAGRMETGPLPPGAVVGAGEANSSQSIVLPPGKGADLVQGFCSGCHDLGRVVSTRRTAQSWQQYTSAMLTKGDMHPPAAIERAISAYLAANFGTRDEH
jgi:cytochrome c5